MEQKIVKERSEVVEGRKVEEELERAMHAPIELVGNGKDG